jgi:hypothetical protein
MDFGLMLQSVFGAQNADKAAKIIILVVIGLLIFWLWKKG